MRALDQEVKDAVWAATEPLLPQREDSHPLGTHRRRLPDPTSYARNVLALWCVDHPTPPTG